MKNILGKKEDLKLFNENGKLVYEFINDFNGFSWERTYDEKGNKLTWKDLNGFSYESTYDEKGNKLTFKTHDGFSWERTYDEKGNELTFKSSSGVTRGFDIPEYTMEELVAKLGNFKIKK